MKILKLLALTTIASFAITACDSDDGMAEKTGAAMDDAAAKIEDAATDVGNAVEDVCEDVKQSVDAKDTDC